MCKKLVHFPKLIKNIKNECKRRCTSKTYVAEGIKLLKNHNFISTYNASHFIAQNKDCANSENIIIP